MKYFIKILILINCISIFPEDLLTIVDWELVNIENSKILLSEIVESNLEEVFNEEFSVNINQRRTDFPLIRGKELNGNNISFISTDKNLYYIKSLFIKDESIIIPKLKIKIGGSIEDLKILHGEPDYIWEFPFIRNPPQYYFYENVSPNSVKDYVYQYGVVIEDNVVTGIILSNIKYKQTIFESSLVGVWKNPAGEHHEAEFTFNEDGTFDFNGLTAIDFSTNGSWELYYLNNKPILKLVYIDDSLIQWTNSDFDWSKIRNVYKAVPENREIHLFLEYEIDSFMIVTHGKCYREVIEN